MITEVAQLTIKDGMQAEFEAGAAKARELFRRAKGFHGLELQRSIEKPNLYFLIVKWATLENHTVDFRESEDFKSWRGLVGHCFARPPDVVHTELAVSAN
jgi:heme-degrading monooxygenase HmoA